MGIIRGGVLGGFRKKTGSVVGSYWRTLDVIRGLPRISGKAPTQLQLDQQAKFKLVTSFLSGAASLINVGYKAVSKVATPMNEAVSYHLRNAVTGVSPNFAIDPAKVKYSTGKLQLPFGIELETLAGGKLNYSWTHTEIDGKLIDATDMATVMVFSPAKQRFVELANVAARSELQYSLQLPSEFVGDMVDCYISFNSVIKKMLVSESHYIASTEII